MLVTSKRGPKTANRFGHLNSLLHRITSMRKACNEMYDYHMVEVLDDIKKIYLDEQIEINRSHCKHEFIKGDCIKCGLPEKLTIADVGIGEVVESEDESYRCPHCGRWMRKLVSPRDGKRYLVCLNEHYGIRPVYFELANNKKR